MITAGEVGAVFKIVDEASPVLKALAEQFTKLQTTIERTKTMLKELRFPPGINKGLGTMAEKLAALDRVANTAAGGVDKAFASMDASIATTIGEVKKLQAEMRGLGRTASAGGGVLGGAASGGGAGGGRRGNMRYHAHESGLGFHFRARAEPVDGMHIMGLTPGAIAGIGAGFATYESVKRAMDLASIQNQLRINGVSEKDIADATNLSYDLGQKWGQNVQDVLQTINEIRNPLGGIRTGMEHANTLAKVMPILKGLDIKKGGGSDIAGELYNLVKGGELRNAITPEKFDAFVDAATRVAVATAGRVGPSEFLQMEKMMKAALPGVSDDFLFHYAPELAQEFKGSPAGTYMASLYQQIVSGNMLPKGMDQLMRLGELDPKKVEFTKDGHVKRLLPGANRFAGMFMNNPMDYAQHLVQELDAHGVHDPQIQQEAISQIFGNRNAAWMVDVLNWQKARLDRGAAGIRATETTDQAAKTLLENDPKTNLEKMNSSWNNMLTSWGTLLMPSVTKFFQDASDLANFIRDPNTSSDWVNLKKKFQVAPHGDYAPPGEGYGSKPYPYMNNQDLQGIGNIPPRSMVVPQVTVNDAPKVTVNVTLDGRAIAAAVSTMIVKDNRVTNSSADHDGRAGFSLPDSYNF